MNSSDAERRPVVGYEGLYEVSSDGNVFRVASGKGARAGRKLKPWINQVGYLTVVLYCNGVKKQHAVHRIVNQAFNLNPYNLPDTNHINGIKTDNHADNLEPSNHSLNGLHAYRILGFVNPMKGKSNPNGGRPKRPVRGTHIKSGEIVEMESLAAAARFLNCRDSYIWNACQQGKQKTAYGCRWEYV